MTESRTTPYIDTNRIEAPLPTKNTHITPNRRLPAWTQGAFTLALAGLAAGTLYAALNKDYNNRHYQPTDPATPVGELTITDGYAVRTDPWRNDSNQCATIGAGPDQHVEAQADVYIEDNDSDPNGPWYGFNELALSQAVQDACSGDIDGRLWIAKSGITIATQ